MKKKRTFIILILLVIFVMVLIDTFRPIKISIDTERVEEINIYDIGSEKSVDISDKEKIEEYSREINNLQVKKKKLVSNSSADGIIIIPKDKAGNVMETIYLSDKDIIYHNWLVAITEGSNPYEKFIRELNN